MMNRISFLVLIMGLMISCQTIEITKDSYGCAQLDWFEVGRSDGLQGRPDSHLKTRQEECQGFQDDFALQYKNGWYIGLDEYCTPANGFAIGQAGQAYENVCSSQKEPQFLGTYLKGKKIFEYESKNRQLTQQLVDLEETSQVLSPDELQKQLKRRTALETELELNKALISELKKDIKIQ